MNMGFRSCVAPWRFLAGTSMQIAHVSKPRPAAAMIPFGIQQRVCRRTFLRLSDVGESPQSGVPADLIGIEQRLCHRALFRISDIAGGVPFDVPTKLIGIR